MNYWSDNQTEPAAVWIKGSTEWMYKLVLSGWKLYYVNFMFEPLGGPRSGIIPQMRRGIHKFYGRFCTEFVHDGRAKSEQERLPQLWLFPDLPVLKNPRHYGNIIEISSYFSFNSQNSPFFFGAIMPRPRRVLNAFTAKEVRRYTGLSLHMINYLSRCGYVEPFYGQGTRGKVRFYSYRDLAIADIVQRLRLAGVELARLKKALGTLREDHAWIHSSSRRSKPIQWLVTDGKNVLLKHDDGFLDELRPGGQRSFAFIVTLQTVQNEVRARIEPRKRERFDIQNHDLIYDVPRAKALQVRRAAPSR